MYFGFRVVLVSRNANNSSKAGVFIVNANNTFSNDNTNIGTQLCLLYNITKYINLAIKIFCIFVILGIGISSFYAEKVRTEPFPISFISVHNLKICTMKSETWKPIKFYENIYNISNFGRVKNIKTGRILKYGINSCGYKLVTLCNKTQKAFKIHLLVYDAFGEEKRNGRLLQVDHKDESKLNNHIDNLQLLNNRENTTKYQLTQKRSSKYAGVYWNKKAKKWLAQIRINDKRKYLGLFDNEHEANLKYQEELKINKYYSLT